MSVQLIVDGVTVYQTGAAATPAVPVAGCPPGYRPTGTIFGGFERIPGPAPVAGAPVAFAPGIAQERATSANIVNPPGTTAPFRFPKAAGGCRFVSLLRNDKNTLMDSWSLAIDVAAEDTTAGKLYPNQFIVTQGISGAQQSFVVMSLSQTEFDTSGPWSTPSDVTGPLFFGVNDPSRVVPGYPTINLTTGRWYLNVHWSDPSPTAATHANGYNGNIDIDGYFN